MAAGLLGEGPEPLAERLPDGAGLPQEEGGQPGVDGRLERLEEAVGQGREEDIPGALLALAAALLDEAVGGGGGEQPGQEQLAQ